ncbi:hypothetical protein ACFVUN_23275 [Kitasatospora griseola]|uniref:hypothetical protein n=1 Tax=Kitasatospora griseola TaxID=2064 RepID=UPI0036DE4FE5
MHETTARAIVTAPNHLQKMKHADARTQQGREQLPRILAAVEGALVMGGPVPGGVKAGPEPAKKLRGTADRPQREPPPRCARAARRKAGAGGRSPGARSVRMRWARTGWRQRPVLSRAVSAETSSTASGSTGRTSTVSRPPHPAENVHPVHGCPARAGVSRPVG